MNVQADLAPLSDVRSSASRSGLGQLTLVFEMNRRNLHGNGSCGG